MPIPPIASTPVTTEPACTEPQFAPGKVVSTPAATAMEAFDCQPLVILKRHTCGDWGEIDAEDAAANDEALRCGLRLLSAYDIGPDTTIWLITEADRSATTVLLPEEY